MERKTNVRAQSALPISSPSPLATYPNAKVVEAATGNLFLNTGTVINSNLWSSSDRWISNLSAWFSWTKGTGYPGTFKMVVVGRSVGSQFVQLSNIIRYPDNFPDLPAVSNPPYLGGWRFDCSDFKGAKMDLIALQIWDFRGLWNGANNLSVQAQLAFEYADSV